MGAAEGDLEVDLLSEGLERLRGLGPASPNSGRGKVVRLSAGDPAGDGLLPPNKSLSNAVHAAMLPTLSLPGCLCRGTQVQVTFPFLLPRVTPYALP